MRFNLKRPCENCPFRTSTPPFLTEARARQIAGALERHTFACHKTISHDDDGRPVSASDDSHCAGALIMMFHEQAPGDMVQIAHRLGLFNPDDLDMRSPVFKSRTDFVEAHSCDRFKRPKLAGGRSE